MSGLLAGESSVAAVSPTGGWRIGATRVLWRSARERSGDAPALHTTMSGEVVAP